MARNIGPQIGLSKLKKNETEVSGEETRQIRLFSEEMKKGSMGWW